MKMNLFRMFVTIFIFITIFGCTKKQETIFHIDEIFEKTATIALEEVEDMPIFIFTDFGFYTFETSFSKISKYNNTGEYELSFGKKGSGPGEIELGVAISYSENDKWLGIFDVTRFSISYFDSNGDFLEYGEPNVLGIPHFLLCKDKITVNTYTQLPKNSIKKIYIDVIAINDEKILEKDAKFIDDSELVDFYLYSIKKNNVFVLDRRETDFDIFSYNPTNKELQKNDLDKNQIKIDDKDRITSFSSIDDYLIVSIARRYQKAVCYFFDLKGNFLGIVDFGKELKIIAGAYNNYLYIYRRDKQDNQFMDIYKINE